MNTMEKLHGWTNPKILEHPLFQVLQLPVAELAAKPKAGVVFCRVQGSPNSGRIRLRR